MCGWLHAGRNAPSEKVSWAQSARQCCGGLGVCLPASTPCFWVAWLIWILMRSLKMQRRNCSRSCGHEMETRRLHIEVASVLCRDSDPYGEEIPGAGSMPVVMPAI